MASIYNIDEWKNTSIQYNANDIVRQSTNFWYCTKDHTSSDEFFPEEGSIYWDGVRTLPLPTVKKTWPYFFWAASYSFDTTHEPKILSVQLGDGYEQRMPDGINHDRLQFSLNFEKRTKKEATAIIHFLSTRQGYKSFYFRAPEPYNIIKKFVCTQWSSSIAFEDNYTVSASFSEKS